MRIKNKLVSIVCIITLFFPMIVFADPPSNENNTTNEAETVNTALSLGRVSQLSLGQPAPFPGVLFSTEAAARLFGDIKFTERECQLRISRELQINTAQLTAQINALKLRLEVESTRTTQISAIKDQRIKYLEENYTPPAWYESGEFWFATGVISGVILSVAAGYAIGQAGK